jgi:hypothetical protein
MIGSKGHPSEYGADERGNYCDEMQRDDKRTLAFCEALGDKKDNESGDHQTSRDRCHSAENVDNSMRPNE